VESLIDEALCLVQSHNFSEENAGPDLVPLQKRGKNLKNKAQASLFRKNATG